VIEFFSKYKNINKILVIITSIAFIGGLSYTLGFNISSIFSHYAIKVGDITFSKYEYIRTYDRLRQKFSNLDEDTLKKLVLNYLITQGILLDFAKKNKIYISDDFVKEFIAETFLKSNVFSAEAFSKYAHQIGYSPSELFKEIKKELLLEKVKFYISQAPYVTNLEALALYQISFAKRNFKILELTPSMFKVKIRREDIIKFINSHKDGYENLLEKIVYYKVFPKSESLKKIKKEILFLKQDENYKKLSCMPYSEFISKFKTPSSLEGTLEINGSLVFYKVTYDLRKDIESFPPKLLQAVKLEKTKEKLVAYAQKLYQDLLNGKQVKLPKNTQWQFVLYNQEEFLKNFHLLNPEDVSLLYMWPENVPVPPLPTKEGIIIVIPEKYYFVTKNKINNTKLETLKSKILSYKQKFILNYFINTQTQKIPIYINKEIVK